MWNHSLSSIFFIIAIGIVSIMIITSQKYNIYKKYKKVINIYREKLSSDISNELVYQYITDIERLPKIENIEGYVVSFTELYNLINSDKKISDDLKFQLKVILSLKGIRV